MVAGILYTVSLEPSMQRHLPFRCLLLLAGLLHAAAISAHGEGPAQRYVSPFGVDVGNCNQHAAPCRTVSYAASHAGKGDSILIESGNYPVADAMDVFHLTSGMLLKGNVPAETLEFHPNLGPTVVSVPLERLKEIRQESWLNAQSVQRIEGSSGWFSNQNFQEQKRRSYK